MTNKFKMFRGSQGGFMVDRQDFFDVIDVKDYS